MDTHEPVEAEVVEDVEEPAALQEITKAELDVAIVTAHRFPRSIQQFKDRTVAMATLDEETAEGCGYALKRGGKVIKGPSIRLAEIAASCFGNIRFGARILGETEDGKFIRAQGVCHDLEHNVYVSLETTRRITDKEGRRYSDDMIGTTANAAASIALRNAIFRVVPKALIKPAYEASQKVVRGDAKSLTERRDRALTKLQTLSPLITEERILAVVDRASVEDVTPADLEVLYGLHTAIKAGNTSVEEAFPPTPKVSVKDLDEKGGDRKEEDSLGTTTGEGKAGDDLTDSGPSPTLSREAQARIGRALPKGLKFSELVNWLRTQYGTGDLDWIPADEETHILKWIKGQSKEKR